MTTIWISSAVLLVDIDIDTCNMSSCRCSTDSLGMEHCPLQPTEPCRDDYSRSSVVALPC